MWDFETLREQIATETVKLRFIEQVPIRIVGRGERCDRRLWRVKGAERVAAVGVQRSRAVGKAHTGHRNRNCSRRSVAVAFDGGTKAPPYGVIRKTVR